MVEFNWGVQDIAPEDCTYVLPIHLEVFTIVCGKWKPYQCPFRRWSRDACTQYLLALDYTVCNETTGFTIYIYIYRCEDFALIHSFGKKKKKKKIDKFINSFEILALKVSYPNQMEEIG